MSRCLSVGKYVLYGNVSFVVASKCIATGSGSEAVRKDKPCQGEF
jgi:hypothetical protein